MGSCCSKDTMLLPFSNPRAADYRLSPRVQSDRDMNGIMKYLSRRPSAVQAYRSAFEKLPDNLLKRIFELLPSSSLLAQMRCVCQRWNALILSSEISARSFTGKNVLFNFATAELALRVYSPRATHWELESKALSFILDTRIDPQDRVAADNMWPGTLSSRWLRLVAAGGGLLCFTSSWYFWAFIVCNPLTKKWRRLQMPFANGLENSMPPPPWALKLWNSKNRVMDWQAKLDEELAVGMIVDSDESSEKGRYRVIVAGLYEGSERATLVYDSTTEIWRKIAEVPAMPSKESRFCSRAITCHGDLYCLTGEFQDRYATIRRPTRLLKCDLKKETWTEVALPLELGFPNDLVEHCGKILLLTHDRYNIGNSLSFYELREHNSEISFAPTELPKTLTVWLNDCRKQSNFHFSVRCLGTGNILYISTKMDKEHKVLVYNDSDQSCTTTKSPKNADYIYDAGWQVFTPAFHAAV